MSECNHMSSQEDCAGCDQYISNIEILKQRKFEQIPKNDTTSWPDDVYWKNCTGGPEVWLNCKRRIEQRQWRKMTYKDYVKYLIEKNRAETAWQTNAGENTK